MNIEESFDTMFNMGYGAGKLPMDERVKGFLNLGFKEHKDELSIGVD